MGECRRRGAKTLAIVNVVGSAIAKTADYCVHTWAGPEFAVALEGALKMKEISYLHAEAYAAGELKHGTIALVQEGQPVIALCCNESVTEKTMSNMVEVKTRGAKVLALAFGNNQRIVSLADDMLYIPRVEPLLCPVVEMIPLQMPVYYVARERGCDIDKPRNLAKSVTVE